MSESQPSIVVRVFIRIVRAYQIVLSPWIGQQCRFHPSCSSYAVEAVRRFGLLCGLWLAVFRILRCNPFCHGGFDPVPRTFSLRPVRTTGNEETSRREESCCHPK